MSFIFVSKEQVYAVKQNLSEKSDYWQEVSYELRNKAELQMKRGPWSVTFSKSPAISGDIHDYFSEGPYWWPNPEDPTGPYIRKDGEHNPNIFKNHHDDMIELSRSVLYLSMAGYYLNEKIYIERAIYLLRIWFVDDKTRMNPHLEYGQAIRGICDGRYIGIIDTHYLIALVHSICFLEEYDEHADTIASVKKWFKEYLFWLTTSEKGMGERNHGNNHSNWWNTQVAAYAALVGDEKTLEKCYDFYKKVIVPSQIDEEGKFSDEVTRTNSFSYSFFNLDACALLCEIAFHRGTDLWHYSTADGRGIESAVKYLIPYFDNPFLWPYQQINGEIPDENYTFHLSVSRLGLEECKRINIKRSKDKYLIRDQSPLGPLFSIL
jgi:hypothetical protein